MLTFFLINVCIYQKKAVSLHYRNKDNNNLIPKSRKGTKIMKYNANEIKNLINGANEVEIYKYSDRTHRLHTDFITSVDCDDIDSLPFDGQGEIDVDVEVMDAERYNETICANSSLEFSDMYEDGDKVAVIVVRTWNTFDVVFQSDDSSNSKGFNATRQYCEDYIRMYNGTNESYFEDYKGGTVQIVCNETEEVVYEEEVK